MDTSSLVIAEPAVCLIDSDPAVRDSIQELASLYGHRVRCFSTARTFLDEVHLIAVRCVICEARLPDQRGIEVFMTLTSRGLDLPFVLLVSRDKERILAEAEDCGIPLVVPKPIMDALPLINFIRAQFAGIPVVAVPVAGGTVGMTPAGMASLSPDPHPCCNPDTAPAHGPTLER